MKRRSLGVVASALFGALAVVLLARSGALAHCDGLDGPVVTAARQALEKVNVNPVLIWVQKQDEGAIIDAFHKTLAVRKLSPEAKELADMHFFETVVRVHRAGEGEPYTGLKPAGRDLGPAIAAADKAVDAAKIEPLSKLLNTAMQSELKERFGKLVAAKKYRPDDVDAGRAYVQSYVSFLTYVEHLYEALAGAEQSHGPAGSEEPHQKH